MDCISFSKNIEKYLSDALSDSEMNDFLLHESECTSCGDELETNFIVSEGIKLLDRDDADYDLTTAFRLEMVRARKRMKFRKIMIRLSYISDTILFWAVVCAVFVYIRVSFL